MQVNLTQKERMLLEDQKSHEEICIQKYSNYANQVQDPQLKQICKNNEQIERSHLNTINQLLSGNVPQMNQQQGGQKNQGADENVNKSQTATSNLSDKEICSDLLMTEKYVSGAYDTAIFEFKDTEVRDVLNHIQKEEQKHGESIFKYMESKGMYNVQ
ncbi:spore coat protein [Clostridium beijerinckii]|uniref:spore coat protein n=1 Tax=Clostridium beijerinckii TaxID=1520 RepID=UPI00098C2714|nr:spore coat protein [Clostridium beijerinckii]MBA8934557.1 spore coat protein CotF [Clostridium beijerinckii]NRU38743.1 spore coat protein CotF [Clostridium beijerinckii]NSA97978.1 spore coat protein CotF [Clostridium beijerinckii]OOM57673.1 coat F domain protein [Clostridium beijerinckii]OOM73118.1 coat F domain protein [Clostridium beijerinckii]